MKISVNGKTIEQEGPLSLSALMETLGVDPARTVAELNGEIVMREKFAAETVNDGDRVELVRFVGGG